MKITNFNKYLKSILQLIVWLVGTLALNNVYVLKINNQMKILHYGTV